LPTAAVISTAWPGQWSRRAEAGRPLFTTIW
jgi:hypothetical protein